MTLGKIITHKRESLNYKKIEFSKILGIGSDTLLAWEKDKFKPAGKNLYKLIKILKFTKEEATKYCNYQYLPDSLFE